MKMTDWYDALWFFVMLAAWIYFGIQLANFLHRPLQPLLNALGGA